uniref:Glutamyl-tRNA(Gln) amidotransferase subunit C, chloroplastic/mitochondrial n=1 Tax=Araucaria cunninghamii TaxID=56994 RepID=A0A0D6R7E4_ARACU
MASLRSVCRNLSAKSCQPCRRVSSQTSRPWRFYSARCNMESPDVLQLAAKARISLTPNEVEEFGPKIGQVIDWFGQLQNANLENVEPTIRADIDEPSSLRPDAPIIFNDRETMVATIPTLEEPYIKVPKILKDNME